MIETVKNPASFTTAADNTEQLVHTGRCKLFGLYPSTTTQGTITLRDGLAGTVKHVCEIGLLEAGKTFGLEGVEFSTALTVELSDGADDSVTLSWEAI